MPRTTDQIAADILGRQTLRIIELQAHNEALEEQLAQARTEKAPCGCKDGTPGDGTPGPAPAPPADPAHK